jgi:hypothetical protein
VRNGFVVKIGVQDWTTERHGEPPRTDVVGPEILTTTCESDFFWSAQPPKIRESQELSGDVRPFGIRRSEQHDFHVVSLEMVNTFNKFSSDRDQVVGCLNESRVSLAFVCGGIYRHGYESIWPKSQTLEQRIA